jgi:hypothetical protein
MRRVIAAAVVATLGLTASSSFGALALSQTDGASPAVYANGGGTSFGGTLGAGSISFDAVGSNLNVSLTPGNALNDIVVIQLDTKSGGFADNQMDDTADGGRRASSSPTSGGNITFPVAPDYALAIGNFGSVLFELNAGSTPGHLNFLQFNAAQNISIPLSSIGGPAVINWFAYYTAGSGFMSSESMPQTSFNAGGNLGTGATATIENHNQFVIPEPATLGALAGAGLLALRRRK